MKSLNFFFFGKSSITALSKYFANPTDTGRKTTDLNYVQIKASFISIPGWCSRDQPQANFPYLFKRAKPQGGASFQASMATEKGTGRILQKQLRKSSWSICPRTFHGYLVVQPSSEKQTLFPAVNRNLATDSK